MKDLDFSEQFSLGLNVLNGWTADSRPWYASNWGPVHTNPGKSTNASICIRLVLPSKLKQNSDAENDAFRKRSLRWINVKTLGLRCSVDRRRLSETMTFDCNDTAMTLPQACAIDREAHQKNGRWNANEDLSVHCTNLSPETTRHIEANIFVAPTPEASAVLNVLKWW